MSYIGASVKQADMTRLDPRGRARERESQSRGRLARGASITEWCTPRTDDLNGAHFGQMI